jgi:hypothetical protein
VDALLHLHTKTWVQKSQQPRFVSQATFIPPGSHLFARVRVVASVPKQRIVPRFRQRLGWSTVVYGRALHGSAARPVVAQKRIRVPEKKKKKKQALS